MSRLRVLVRLRFVRLPNTREERVFRDAMIINDLDDCGYESLSTIVERKLRFMEIPPCDFTVFYCEDNGDRVVVDDAYFALLAESWAPRARRSQQLGKAMPESLSEAQRFSSRSPCNDDDDEHGEEFLEASASFEVEVHTSSGEDIFGNHNTSIAAALRPVDSNRSTVPLTMQNLTRAMCATETMHHGHASALVQTLTAPPATPSAEAEVRLHVGDLTCPPVTPLFYLRCVLLALRFKTPKPGVTVAELDFCDANDTAQQITAVTFDEVVQRAVRDHLRGDRRHVVELRNVQTRRKSDVDARYQTNAHPLQLRLDRGTKLEVVQVLSVPVAVTSAGDVSGSGHQHQSVVTIRNLQPAGGVVDLSDLVGLHSSSNGSSNANHHHSTSGGQAIAPLYSALSSTSSSSVSCGPRRTVFSFSSGSGTASGGNAGSTAPAIAGAVPSILGNQLRAQQDRIVQHRPPEELPPQEPGVIQVTARDVRRREPFVEQHASNELLRKERIRRRREEVSQECLICGLDCTAKDVCLSKVRNVLEANSRNGGVHIPTLEELIRALSDRRRRRQASGEARLLCAAHFVNTTTKTTHIVHARCAHLCSTYQSGADLEDTVVCDIPYQYCALCRMSGACVACYHPDCKEMYHVVCALFSGGYVNFGKKDPFLPCPACPRHTQVDIARKESSTLNVLHLDTTCWDDDVVFDSRVVESTDLRDPDDNDGA